MGLDRSERRRAGRGRHARALLALAACHDVPSCSAADRVRIEAAAAAGIGWLLDLQNRDGGWPTFCRGWGKLPFDRSGADLTAHALRAFKCWEPFGSDQRSERSVQAGFRYLARQQRPDGSWVPLWFGNQNDPHGGESGLRNRQGALGVP